MTFEPGESVAAEVAIPLTADGTLWLLDVRERDEWDAGHAGLAHHVPLAELGLRQGELPDDAVIAVICHAGYRSRLVTDALLEAGYEAVDVAGGMIAWEASGGDVVACAEDDGAG